MEKPVLGAGFHPAYLFRPEDPRHIPLAPAVQFMELGLAELPRFAASDLASAVAVSLHIARSPIAEVEAEQDAFIRHAAAIAHAAQSVQIKSTGFHLTGERDCGIGALGFSSQYIFDSRLESRAIRFLSAYQAATAHETWLENAGFYPRSVQDLIASWKSFARIVTATDSRSILDLTHVMIESHNLGLHSDVILGLVPWESIAEIHVSGFVAGRDGALHDGHSQPLAEPILELLRKVLKDFCPEGSAPVVTVEHTDLAWVERKNDFKNDFLVVKSILENVARPETAGPYIKQLDYAVSNLTRIFGLRYPQLAQAISTAGYDPKSLMKDWAEQILSRQEIVVFSLAEIPEEQRGRVKVMTESFTNYVQEKVLCG